MIGGKNCVKKTLYSSFPLLLSAMMYGMSVGYTHSHITDNDFNKVIHVAQNDDNINNTDNNDDMDWGWVGLIG